MNNLMNSIFGRMFLSSPNHFINCMLKNNQNHYHEYFHFNKDIYGSFDFSKTYISDKKFNIDSNIVIVDEIKQIQYIENYNFKKIEKYKFENHVLRKMQLTTNNCNSIYKPYCTFIEFINFNDIPKNIQQLIYSKTDNDIISSSCCGNHK